MIITVRLDVASLQSQNDRRRTTEKPTRRSSLEKEKRIFENARIQNWLEETYEEGPWNGLEDARNNEA